MTYLLRGAISYLNITQTRIKFSVNVQYSLDNLKKKKRSVSFQSLITELNTELYITKGQLASWNEKHKQYM